MLLKILQWDTFISISLSPISNFERRFFKLYIMPPAYPQSSARAFLPFLKVCIVCFTFCGQLFNLFLTTLALPLRYLRLIQQRVQVILKYNGFIITWIVHQIFMFYKK